LEKPFYGEYIFVYYQNNFHNIVSCEKIINNMTDIIFKNNNVENNILSRLLLLKLKKSKNY